MSIEVAAWHEPDILAICSCGHCQAIQNADVAHVPPDKFNEMLAFGSCRLWRAGRWLCASDPMGRPSQAWEVQAALTGAPAQACTITMTPSCTWPTFRRAWMSPPSSACLPPLARSSAPSIPCPCSIACRAVQPCWKLVAPVNRPCKWVSPAFGCVCLPSWAGVCWHLLGHRIRLSCRQKGRAQRLAPMTL